MESNPPATSAESSANAQPPRKGSLLVIFLTVFIDLLGFGIVLPLLPIYGKQFAESSGLDERHVGWVTGLLMSSFSIMQLLFLPFWGRLSDRLGRRPVLLIGLAGSTLFYGLFGIAMTYKSLVGLFISRIGAGIAGATISTAQAYIADCTSRETRNRGMALIGAAFALGFTLGPIFGSVALFMGDRSDLSPWPGYLASLLSGAALLLAIWKLRESWHPGSEQASRPLLDAQALRLAVNTPSIAWLLLATLICVFSFANFEATLSLQIKRFVDEQSAGQLRSELLDWILRKVGRTASDSGGVEFDSKLAAIFVGFAYLGIVLTLVQGFLVRRLAGRISEGAMIGIGTLSALVGFTLLAHSAHERNVNLFAIAMAVEVLGFAFLNPSLQSLISRRTDPQFQGGILGLSQSSSSLGRILGPIAGASGFVFHAALPYLIGCGALVVGGLVVAHAVRAGQDFGPGKAAEPK